MKGYTGQVKHLRVNGEGRPQSNFAWKRKNTSQNYSKTLTWVRPSAWICPQNTPKFGPTSTDYLEMGHKRHSRGTTARRKKKLMEVSKEEEGDCYLLLQALLKVCQKY